MGDKNDEHFFMTVMTLVLHIYNRHNIDQLYEGLYRGGSVSFAAK